MGIKEIGEQSTTSERVKKPYKINSFRTIPDEASYSTLIFH